MVWILAEVHWRSGKENKHAYRQAYFNKLDVTQFHVYAIEWSRRNIKWFVDGKRFYKFKIRNGPPGPQGLKKPHYLLLNLAVGGNWPGSPDSSTAFPAKLIVDYVRVYEIK